MANGPLWDAVRAARVPATGREFLKVLDASGARVQGVLAETGGNHLEHGTTICWVPGKGPMISKVQEGQPTTILLAACPREARATGTIHSHPDEPLSPTLSLLDQEGLFLGRGEVAQAVVGREFSEVMLAPRVPGLQRVRGQVTVKALDALVRRGLLGEREATELVKVMFPSLFLTVPTPPA